MRKTIRTALAVALVLSPLWLQAQVSKTATIVLSTEFEDGTPMLPGQVTESHIYFGLTSGGPYDFATEILPGSTVMQQTAPIFNAGAYFAVATTLASIDGGPPQESSSYSPEASFVVGLCQANPAGCRPKPPTSLTIQ